MATHAWTAPFYNMAVVQTLEASAALATKFIAVALNSDEQVAACADAAAGIGILLDVATAQGDMVRVCMVGICPIKANAAITAGTIIGSGASTGKLATNVTSGDYTLGIALDTATAQDDEITAFICPSSGQIN